MYRKAKIDSARSASLEAEADKEARKAILFSLIAMMLSVVEKGSTAVSVVGITIDVKDQYILNGTFCALALFYGFAVFSTGMQLYSAGRRNEFLGMYRRIICWVRNKTLKDRYHPGLAKFVSRGAAFLMTSINAVMGFLFLFVYVVGVSLTFSDLLRTADLLWGKVFG